MHMIKTLCTCCVNLVGNLHIYVHVDIRNAAKTAHWFHARCMLVPLTGFMRDVCWCHSPDSCAMYAGATHRIHEACVLVPLTGFMRDVLCWCHSPYSCGMYAGATHRIHVRCCIMLVPLTGFMRDVCWCHSLISNSFNCDLTLFSCVFIACRAASSQCDAAAGRTSTARSGQSFQLFAS